MAIEVVIKNNSKHQLSIENLEKVIPDYFILGQQNDSFVFKELKKDEAYENMYLVLYNNNKIGRGLEVAVADERNEIFINLPMPCTRQDIIDFYDVISYLCHDLQTTTFIQDDNQLEVAGIADIKNSISNWNDEIIQQYYFDENFKKEQGIDDMQTLLALFPIVIEKQFLEKLKYDTIDTKQKALADYFDEKQKMDVFYPSPLVIKKNDKYIGIYTLGENISTVLPKKPRTPLRLEIKDDLKVNTWLVTVLDSNSTTQARIYYEDIWAVINYDQQLLFDEYTKIITIGKEEIKKLAELAIQKYGTIDILDKI